MVKGHTDLKLFQSTVKFKDVFNEFFVAPGLSDSVIALIGDSPLEGRPRVLKKTCDNPWAWPEVKFCNNYIEMQIYFIQESNHHSMWDTTGETNLTTKKLSRLEVVIYAAVEWLSKCGQIPDYLRV